MSRNILTGSKDRRLGRGGRRCRHRSSADRRYRDQCGTPFLSTRILLGASLFSPSPVVSARVLIPSFPSSDAGPPPTPSFRTASSISAGVGGSRRGFGQPDVTGDRSSATADRNGSISYPIPHHLLDDILPLLTGITDVSLGDDAVEDEHADSFDGVLWRIRCDGMNHAFLRTVPHEYRSGRTVVVVS